MGKSTVGAMLSHHGVPVHEADHAVHQLMSLKGEARPAIAAAFPYFEYPEIYVRKTKEFDRAAFGKIIFADDEKRAYLESILHPLVRMKQAEFIAEHRAKGRIIVCLDIPLLFETGAERCVDKVVCASAPYFLQKQRVMARPGMSAEKFADILARQMPDAEKRRRSDYIIETGLGRAHSMRQVRQMVEELRAAMRGDAEDTPPFEEIEIYS